MKAIQITEPGNIEITHIDKPNIKNNDDVLVKVKLAGVCGSDMHIFHGSYPMATFPIIIGHEVVGEVIKTGPDVNKLKAGDHVVVEPTRSCGNCYACKKGRPNVCQELSVYGVHEDGGMREFIVLPEKYLHKVASDVPWEEAVLAEPYTIGAQAVWRGDVQKDDTVLIQGAGPIGICILKMAKLAGGKCIVSDINPDRLDFAKQSGADTIVDVSKESLVDAVTHFTNGEGVNVAIDAVCLPSTFELSVECVSIAGRVVVLAFDERPSSIPQLPITKKEITILGSRLQTNQFSKVVSLLNQGLLTENGLISHQFVMDDIKEAISFIENNQKQVKKLLIAFE
ncbi:zinc-binding alcohol dehydrogenase family protein [Alkalihalobacillus sp. BA299]|uniref:zinc-binding alcohol dehydrogenase family protein n=1 Tax=Alkalihalobacillus sp. BA299 TaxID=2815938 RepID=UPI001AD9C256|nr:zinc-binding alcohol dehydrogenase family protein [Alkalihalobacillus sp. BA299]